MKTENRDSLKIIKIQHKPISKAKLSEEKKKI